MAWLGLARLGLDWIGLDERRAYNRLRFEGTPLMGYLGWKKKGEEQKRKKKKD